MKSHLAFLVAFMVMMVTAIPSQAVNSSSSVLTVDVLFPGDVNATHVPLDDIECETTLPEYDAAARTEPLEKYLFWWLRRNDAIIDPTPEWNGRYTIVQCCDHAGITVYGHNITDMIPLHGRYVATLAAAVVDHCRQGSHAKGRAWESQRRYTVEVGQVRCMQRRKSWMEKRCMLDWGAMN